MKYEKNDSGYRTAIRTNVKFEIILVLIILLVLKSPSTSNKNNQFNSSIHIH